MPVAVVLCYLRSVSVIAGAKHFCDTVLADKAWCSVLRLVYCNPRMTNLIRCPRYQIVDTCIYSHSPCGGTILFDCYLASVFGEDALVNVSVEKKDDGKLAGYIRIRSKTQGIALSLGDRITSVQRGHAEGPKQ